MQIADKYAPQQIESEMVRLLGCEHRLFHSEPDEREPYTIVIPPPNVTGMLHMGHMLNNTLQDVLVRRARMQGKNACWVPGTDHASIATEAKVVAKLKAEGHREIVALARRVPASCAWDWKEKYGGVILQQLRKLGASCDWERTCFTMDDSSYRKRPARSSATSTAKGSHLPRAYAWSTGIPSAQDRPVGRRGGLQGVARQALLPALSRSRAPTSTLVVATTRPETILGDTAALRQSRRRALRVAAAKTPASSCRSSGRSMPGDPRYVCRHRFRHGCLEGYAGARRERLHAGREIRVARSIDIFNDDGTINDKVGLLRRYGALRPAQADRRGSRRGRPAWRKPKTTPTTWAIPNVPA